jgi:hypothetical protein
MENKYIRKTLKDAEESFTRREYNKAMSKYSKLLTKYPTLQDARVGAILSDMASESENEAQALFDYYTVVKQESPDTANDIIEDLIKSFDGNMDEISTLLNSFMNNKEDTVDGISYEDFKAIVDDSGDFNRAFENIMFSTKIVITHKNDFFEFIHDLIVHKYYEIALNYLESASETFIGDERVSELFIKLKAIVGDNRSE